MTDQPTFSDLVYQVKKRKTRREEFLEKLEGLVPWPRLGERIRPHYFHGQRGRRPYPLSVMLRVHIVNCVTTHSESSRQALSDPAMEVPRLRGGSLCCTRRSRCGGLPGCGCRSPFPMRASYCTSATCSNGISWGRDCLKRSRTTWQSRGSGSGREPSWTPPS